jgi:hypothetical protein
MPIKSEFGFRIDFADDPTPVEALKALTSTRTRAQEVTQVDPILGRGRYVGVIINRRGDDALRAVQDSVQEMEAAGLEVTSVRGVARNGKGRTPYTPLDEITEQANVWIADRQRQGSGATPVDAASAGTPRPLPASGRGRSGEGPQPARSQQIAWLRTCVDRIIDDCAKPGDEAFAVTPVGAEADRVCRYLAQAQDTALSAGDLRLLRKRLIALYLSCCERDRSTMPELTRADINQVEAQYSVACISLWRGRKTGRGRIEAIRNLLDRGIQFDANLAATLNPITCAADIVDLLDATAELDQPPHDA